LLLTNLICRSWLNSNFRIYMLELTFYFLVYKKVDCKYKQGILTKVAKVKIIKGLFHQHFKISFYICRSQKRKNTVKPSVFFALLGSVHVKSVHKMLVKLNPGWTLRSNNICRNYYSWQALQVKVKKSLESIYWKIK